MESQLYHATIFEHLIPDELPPPNTYPTHIIITFLTIILRLSLTYPLNLFVFILLSISCIRWFIATLRNPKAIEYYPRPHIERQSTLISQLKKELKEVKN